MEEFASPLITSLLIVALAVLGLVLAQLLNKYAQRAIRSAEQLHPERQQQLLTLVQALRWAVNILIMGLALMMLLSRFGVDVTPLLTSVGIVGLAVGLGAQTLIKDLIGGLLILIENQYAVGDSIQVGEISGRVERLTLRATYLRDVQGRLHIIPNGEVRIVSNMTKEWSRALVEVGVAYEEDLDRVLDVLGRVAETFAQESEVAPLLLEPPQVVGPVSLGDWAVTVRVMVKTQPGQHWEVARALQRRILAACEREGITLPYPRQEVWVRGVGGRDEGDAETR
ncbi:MAG TPA: mechanosensitive ion channel family protein [Anaerolineales bacterium]|nr:mechanosensitive ion channel family protein [Anaerolineales bacterium]